MLNTAFPQECCRKCDGFLQAYEAIGYVESGHTKARFILLVCAHCGWKWFGMPANENVAQSEDMGAYSAIRSNSVKAEVS